MMHSHAALYATRDGAGLVVRKIMARLRTQQCNDARHIRRDLVTRPCGIIGQLWCGREMPHNGAVQFVGRRHYIRQPRIDSALWHRGKLRRVR